MDIIATKKDFKIFKKNNTFNLEIRLDDKIEESIIMVHQQPQEDTEESSFIEWLRGRDDILNYLKLGYIPYIRKCPHRFFTKCIGNKCAFFVVKRNIGDCAHVWSALD